MNSRPHFDLNFALSKHAHTHDHPSLCYSHHVCVCALRSLNRIRISHLARLIEINKYLAFSLSFVNCAKRAFNNNNYVCVILSGPASRWGLAKGVQEGFGRGEMTLISSQNIRVAKIPSQATWRPPFSVPKASYLL